MAYNIRFDDSRAGQLSWATRGEMVTSIMRFHEADLIGVQEALQHQLASLEQMLPGFRAFGVARDDGKTKGEYSAILYRTTRFELVRGGTFWLSQYSYGCGQQKLGCRPAAHRHLGGVQRQTFRRNLLSLQHAFRPHRHNRAHRKREAVDK